MLRKVHCCRSYGNSHACSLAGVKAAVIGLCLAAEICTLQKDHCGLSKSPQLLLLYLDAWKSGGVQQATLAAACSCEQTELEDDALTVWGLCATWRW